jgi:hypothetical protein
MSRLATQRQIYPLPQKEPQAQRCEHHLAKMMPSAVLASSRRVGSRAKLLLNDLKSDSIAAKSVRA